MTQMSAEAAGDHLSDLLQAVMRGEEVVIMKDDQPVARLVSVANQRTIRRFGCAKGQITMAADFDAPLADFADYMPPAESQ